MLTCNVMQSFTYENITVIIVADEYAGEDWTTAVAHITGEYDWWYGETGIDGLFAYVIMEVGAIGDTRSPDWQGLPELFKSHIVARLRGEVPA